MQFLSVVAVLDYEDSILMKRSENLELMKAVAGAHLPESVT